MEIDQLPYPPCKHTTERIQTEKSKMLYDAILIYLKNSSNIGKVKDDAWAGMWVQ